MKKKCRLDELKLGGRGKIIKLSTKDKKMRRHLLDMGLTKETEVRIKKIAPVGDPIDIELRGYELCISKNELKNIEVEVL